MKCRSVILIFLALTLSRSAAPAQDSVPLLPDFTKTPGAANPALDQAAICNSAFSTKAFRKATKADRRCVTDRYGKPSYAFTYDHLVPLELGGLDGCDNLWPEARAEAKRKDQLEDALHRQVCYCGNITLAQAQDAIRTNWTLAYARFVTPKGSPMCAVNQLVAPAT